MTPSVTRSSHSGAAPRPISPLVGFSPTRPHSAAGPRADPPASDAVAMGTMPAASATADPPDEPPGDQAVFHGFRVRPKSRFSATPSNANSDVFALPTGIAPAARSSPTTRESVAAAGASANSSDPCVVGKPLEVLDVLHEEREPGQGQVGVAAVAAGGQSAVERFGFDQGGFGAQRDDRVERPVQPFDPLAGRVPRAIEQTGGAGGRRRQGRRAWAYRILRTAIPGGPIHWRAFPTEEGS